MAGQSEGRDKEGYIAGTCMGMCPNAELRLRQREGLVHPLECTVSQLGGQHSRVDPRAMVKEFSRSAAGHQIKSADVRPLPVLIKTMKYLISNVCCREDVPWGLVYQFVSDRVRAVRQDVCVQGVRTPAITIHQAAVRFYAYAQYRTCEYELSDFDPHINRKQLIETLSLVLTLYQEIDQEKIDDQQSSSCCQHDLSLYTQCDVCDCDSDESYSNNSESDDNSESKIAQDAVASEKDVDPEKLIKGSGAVPESKSINIQEQNTEQDTGESSQNASSTSNKLTNNTTASSESSRNTSRTSNKLTDNTTAPSESSQNTSSTSNKLTDNTTVSSESSQNTSSTSNKLTENTTASSPEKRKRDNKPDTKMLKYNMREEAETLNLLVNFGREEALLHVLQLSPVIRQCQLVRIAIQMNLAWLSNNYIRVLRLALLLPPLFLVAFHTHLGSIQRQALGILNVASSSRAGLVYSGDDLATALCFPSTQALYETCSHYGLSTGPTGVIFTKDTFNYDAPVMKASRIAWIDEKLSSLSLSDLLLPPNLG